jgi:predicted DNA-binding transcriptional regulator AlpA
LVPVALEILTTPEVAALFHVDSETILAWVRANRFPRPFKPGHRSLFWHADVIRDALAGNWRPAAEDEAKQERDED